MPQYFISEPHPKTKERLFSVIPFGPKNHIIPGVTLITEKLIWVKYILSCILHKNLDLEKSNDVNEMILNPEFGVYNRILTWTFEYVKRNEEPPSGLLIGRIWGYGSSARKKGRDFFNFIELARLIKYILDVENPEEFLKKAKEYCKNNSKDYEKINFLKEFFDKRVRGVNLSKFSIEEVFKKIFMEMKMEHFRSKRSQFASTFIKYFLIQFREQSKVEELLYDHPFHHYVSFVKGLKVSRKGELLDKFQISEAELKVVIPEPEKLKPLLSDEGFDAALLLEVMRKGKPELFYSFILLNYLEDKKISFEFNYINLYRKIKTKDFRRYLNFLKKSLSRFGLFFNSSEFNEKLLEPLAIWWEYYQFSYIGELVARKIYYNYDNNYDRYDKEEIKNRVKNDLKTLNLFLKNLSLDEYKKVLENDENYREIIRQLVEMKLLTDIDSVFEYLFEKVVSQSSKGEFSIFPFFASFDSFIKLVRELRKKLKLGEKNDKG